MIKYNTINFYPKAQKNVGIFSIQIKVSGSDGRFTTRMIKVTVTNDAPVFTGDYPKNQIIRMNEELKYKMPDFIDLERQIVFVEHTKLPPFCKFEEITYTCKSTKLIGLFDVEGALSDSIHRTPFYFKI